MTRSTPECELTFGFWRSLQALGHGAGEAPTEHAFSLKGTTDTGGLGKSTVRWLRRRNSCLRTTRKEPGEQ